MSRAPALSILHVVYCNVVMCIHATLGSADVYMVPQTGGARGAVAQAQARAQARAKAKC